MSPMINAALSEALDVNRRPEAGPVGPPDGLRLPKEPAVPKHLAYIIVIATFCLLTISFLDAAGVIDSVAPGGKSVLIVRW